jgi:hypothetical protein
MQLGRPSQPVETPSSRSLRLVSAHARKTPAKYGAWRTMEPNYPTIENVLKPATPATIAVSATKLGTNSINWPEQSHALRVSIT